MLGRVLSHAPQVRLDEVLGRRGRSLTELSEAVEITVANLWFRKTGKAKPIQFSRLEAISNALDCQPDDILPSSKTAKTTSPCC